MEINRSLLNKIIDLSIDAGDAILEVYNQDKGFNTETKSDNSPVTDADKTAHLSLIHI